MKKLQLFGIFLASFVLFGCAGTRIDFHEKDLNHQSRTSIVNYGAERAKIIGPVFYEETGECSRISFYRYVVSQNPKADDVIDIKMEEFKKSWLTSCRYSGLAVSYESLSADEALIWKSAGDSIAVYPKDKEKSIVEQRGFGAVIWGSIATAAAAVFLILFIANN